MIRFIATRLRPYRTSLVIIVVLLTAQVIANLWLPLLNADIINNGVVPGDLGHIVRVGGIMLGITLALGVVSVIAVYFSARTAMAFGRDVRRELFRHVERFSLREMNTFGAPTLIMRNTNDVQQVQMMVLLALTMMITAPLAAIGGVFMALRTNVQLSGLLVVVIPLMAVVVGAMVAFAVPLFQAMQVKLDRINGVLRENLSGVRVIRAFVRTRREEQRFADANQDLTDTALRVTRIFAALMPIMMLIFNLSTVAIIWFGGHLVDDGSMLVGDLTAFLSYMMQILFSVMMAVMLMAMVPRAAASAERIAEVLATVPQLTDPEHAVFRTANASAGPGHGPSTGSGRDRTSSAELVEARGPSTGPGHRRTSGAELVEARGPSTGPGHRSRGTVAEPPKTAVEPVPAPRGVVEFRHVEFRYPGAEDPVLRDVNLTMRPGSTTAIVGSTGSGKTTLVNLIPRLADVTAGAVLVDGVDVRGLPLEELWQRIGLVPQKAFLFTGTIASNVRFGSPDASDAEVWDALRTAQAADFVASLPEQLEAPIEQGGANVSGGQRQRLAIARALVRRPAITIFDDSFSALDYATDSRLRAALRKRTADATVIVVAQRVSTIMHADQIVVLDAGAVVGVGTHAELMVTCEVYGEIVSSQLSAAEAAS